MNDEELVDLYCEIWSDASLNSRQASLSAVFAEHGLYVDPNVRIVGLTAFAEHIGAVLSRNPRSVIQRTSAVDRHHHVLRFSWRKSLCAGDSRPEGLDVCEIGDDGLLHSIIGFFGPLRSLEATNL